MKRWIIGCCLLAFGGLLLAGRAETWQVRSNEYFGDGIMIAVSFQQSAISDGRYFGVIKAWGWYGIYGTAEDCRIVPLWSPVGDAATVRCGMKFNEKGTRFSGWMDFRGHPRPFCGALAGKGLPEKCFGEQQKGHIPQRYEEVMIYGKFSE